MGIKNATYNDLQLRFDWFVGKYGLERAIQILDNFLNNQKIEVKDDMHRLQLLTDYVISQCITIFDLKADEFRTSSIPEYRQARMACYHLMKEYTDASYARIAERFDRPLHSVFRYCKICTGILAVPNYIGHKPFVSKYTTLENCIINFISNLA